MPRKQVVVRLPPAPGATPRGRGASNSPRKGAKQISPGSSRSPRKSAWGVSRTPDSAPDSPLSPRRNPWGGDGITCGKSMLLSKASTGVPSEMSSRTSLLKAESLHGASKLLEDSLKMLSSGSLPLRDANLHGDDWEIQSPDQILQDVRQLVQTRKPWREGPDDSLLEKKSYVDCGYADCGLLGGLPDVRVRLMEDQLSLRVRCQLLDTEMPSPPAPKRAPKAKTKPRKAHTPWYLPAHKWFEPEKVVAPEERSGNFPYANEIWNLSDDPEQDEQDRAALVAGMQKESLGIVDAFKQYMKGDRLPHFLL